VSTLNYPEKIDRFIIKDLIGKGAQGVVYLAEDPQLQRQVAIKAVHLQGSIALNERIEQLLTEARTVSQLQHGNIVTIYDSGTHEGNPYLVFEFVDGHSLQQEIQQGIELQRNLSYMREILQGVSIAHQSAIVHCDLKPANILVTRKQHAKVADFGLAHVAGKSEEDTDTLSGTPQYMAPEYIETGERMAVSDVFSLGLVFYEMLTGQSPIQGGDVYQVLNAIAHQDIPAPSTINPKIDEKLDAFLMKALQKDPQQRYLDATAMLRAFEDFLSLSEAEGSADTNQATVDFLLRRMRHKKDFPAFSQTISTLNRASTSDTEGLSSVANAILKDYSLTNKVLRLVNSAYYNRGGAKISTISRAVVMLGINPVRSIAASLMLFEHLQNKAQASDLKEDAVASLYSALVANRVAVDNKIKNHEEAFLCALLHQLGKTLTRYYLHEESQQIDTLVNQKNKLEEAAAVEVLGLPYHQLGRAVAKEWGFPDSFIDSMKPIRDEELDEPGKSVDSLRMIANFSNELSRAMRKPKAEQASALKVLEQQYGKALNLKDEDIEQLVQDSQEELSKFSKLIGYNLQKSQFYQQINPSSIETKEAMASPSAAETQTALGQSEAATVLEQDFQNDERTQEKTLTDGIQDITNTLMGEYTINEIMQMILETIYQAFSGSRVLLCLKDRSGKQMCARYGYGENSEELIKVFQIPLAYKADVFHVAFKNNVDIKIDDTDDPKIHSKIPEWFHQKVKAHSFMIFPIVIKASPIAMIYLDSNTKRKMSISDSQLGLLKTLRNQAVLAIKNLQA